MSHNPKVNVFETHENNVWVSAFEIKNATDENASDPKGESDTDEIEVIDAAGIETKIENYDNKRTQRRHFSETDANEAIDVVTKENGADTENVAEMNEVEKAYQVENKIVEGCEGVHTHRKHFPGSTSNIFRKKA